MKIPTPKEKIEKLGAFRDWGGVPALITHDYNDGDYAIQFFGHLGSERIFDKQTIKNNSKEISVWRFWLLRIRLFFNF